MTRWKFPGGLGSRRNAFLRKRGDNDVAGAPGNGDMLVTNLPRAPLAGFEVVIEGKIHDEP